MVHVPSQNSQEKQKIDVFFSEVFGFVVDVTNLFPFVSIDMSNFRERKNEQ